MMAVDSIPMQSSKKVFLIPWIMCALGALYYCYEYFLRISPSVMTPELMRTYHLTGSEVGSLSAFYYHAYVPMQIIVGLLMDRFGPRRLLTFACLLCAVGTYLFAGSESLLIAKCGRFLVGLGSAFAFVGALKLATIWLPPNRFALVSGIILCLGMLGAMMGDIILRSLVDVMGWQPTLFLAAVAGVMLSIVLWSIIRDRNPVAMHFHVHTISFKDLFIGLWAALKNPQIWLNGLVGFLLYVSLSAFAELWGIPYLEQAKGLTKVDAAFANSLIFLGWAVGGPLWGWFSDHIKLRRTPIIGASIAAFFAICILLYVPSLPLTLVYSLLFIFGVLSSVQILVFAICRETSSPKIAGTAIALTNMIVMIGGNIFQPVIGKFLDLNWNGALVAGARIYPASAYEFALSILPICIFAAIAIMFFIRETHGMVYIEQDKRSLRH